jgi:hypothetical protein
MRRPRCYLACPISKGVLHDNLNNASSAMKLLFQGGFAPLNPAFSAFCGPAFVFESKVWCEANSLGFLTHSEWLELDFSWIEVAELLVRIPGESSGAEAEVAHAKKLRIPVVYGVDEAISWLNNTRGKRDV